MNIAPYSSKDFLEKLLKKHFRFRSKQRSQTDNGTEWTTALLVRDKQSKTMFEQVIEKNDYNIPQDSCSDTSPQRQSRATAQNR